MGTAPLKVKTVKCMCTCPRAVHSHVGCMAKGCECQFGVLTTVVEAKMVGLVMKTSSTAPMLLSRVGKKRTQRGMCRSI